MKNKTEMNILHRIQLIKADMEKAACYQGEANRAMKKAQAGLSALINGTTITRKGMTPVPVKTKAKSFGGALKQYAVEHGVKRKDANGNTYHEVPASDLIIT